MATRRYTVPLAAPELARLRAFDNAAQGRKHWPLGPDRTFMRRDEDTFVVKEHTSMGVGRATVTTLGTATLRDDAADIVIRTKGSWIGWFLVACGAVALLVVPRDGVGAAAVGALLILGGWLLFIRRDHDADLDEIESVLRAEIAGAWPPTQTRTT